MSKYEVYFGEAWFCEETTKGMDLLASFDCINGAERFICRHINENHSPNYYIRIAENENFKWFDYGSHTKFYIIKKKT